MILLFILLFALFTWANAYLHWYEIELKDRSPNHKAWTLYRGIFFAVNALLYTTDYKEIIALILVQIFAFWLAFDMVLNTYRGLPLLYVGKTSYIDKLFAGKPDLMLLTKIIFFLLTLTFAVIII